MNQSTEKNSCVQMTDRAVVLLSHLMLDSPKISHESVMSLSSWRTSVGKKWVSDYVLIDQDRVDAFAVVTGDHQWIHSANAIEWKKSDESKESGMTIQSTESKESKESNANQSIFLHLSNEKKDERGIPHLPLPIVHGYLLVSLFAYFMGIVPRVEKCKFLVNVGINRLRFITPVQVGKRVRMIAELLSVKEGKVDVENTIKCTLEIEGSNKPAVVAECVMKMYF